MDSTAISVAIVEDNSALCENLEEILNESPDFKCVCTCGNARSAYRNIPKLSPSIVIMDIQLPDTSGIVCAAKLKQQLPDLSIIMFTVYEDHDQIFKALQAGASGYLLKSATTDQLLDALRTIVGGGAPMTNQVARKVIQSFHRSPPTPDGERLTPREEEVLQLLAKGLSAKQIAAQLSVSSCTIGNHLKNIYRKLHVRSRVEAILSYLG